MICLTKVNKKFLLFLFLFTISSFSAYAEINNREEANQFLDNYCIEIVSAIKDAYEVQIESVSNQDWKTFGEKGRWIGGLADVYSKLCK
tara:strand:- start:2433 stop:2699 length:267 start_codon:yes stop_codon:yes gene_type:complete